MPGLTLPTCLVAAAQLAAGDVRLSDLDRFPGRECACACYDFAAAHRTWLCGRILGCDRGDLASWRAEHARCLAAWDALAYAWGDEKQPPFPRDRLDHLRQLRTVIGAEAYQAGRMPPCCPWWFFEER